MSEPQDATVSVSAVRGAIAFRRLPWIRPLVGACGEDFGSVASLFAGNPADPAAWRDTIGRVQRGRHNRHALVAMLTRQMAERGAPADARAAAATLADPTSVAVVTGQQAGILGGPFYTLLKATTAIQLARRVRQEFGTPAVPVFWVDGDDHDWQEIRSASVLTTDFDVRDVALADVPGAGARPAASLVLNSHTGEMLAALEAALPQTEFTRDVLAAVSARYRPGVRVTTAFAGWLEDLLGRHGLVVFESADPAGRALAADVIAHELEQPGRTAALAREGADRMRQLGHAPQVEPAEDNVAVFYVDATGRHAIKRSGNDLLVENTVRTSADLLSEAREHPERFSPNVLLRPLVQDRLFPTVCYVAGPSELAYQAQLGGVYKEFRVDQPLLYSRASVTMLDSAAVKFLDRSQLPLEALQAQDESELNRLLERQLPPGLDAGLEDLDREVADRLARLQPTVTAVDPTLGGAVDTTIQKVRETLKTLHNKVVQASKRKDDTLRRQFLRTRALAFPAGAPQERQLSVVFFVNRYGLGLGDRLIESLPLDTNQHYLMVL